MPAEAHALTVDEMTAMMVGEILDGVGPDPIRGGVIGEMGVSRPITLTEKRGSSAAARAERETGIAINIHFDIGSDSAELNHAVDILANAATISPYRVGSLHLPAG